MTAELIDGKAIAQKVRDEVKEKVACWPTFFGHVNRCRSWPLDPAAPYHSDHC